MKKITTIFLIIIMMLIGVNYSVGKIVNYQIESALNSYFKIANIKIEADSTPSMRMLLGDIENLKVNLGDVGLSSGLNFKTLAINAKNIKYNFFSFNKEATLAEILDANGTVQGVITEKDLDLFLQKKINGLDETKTEIDNNKVQIKGHFNIGGIIQGETSINGNLEIKDNTLVFAPLSFDINGIDIDSLDTSMLHDIEIYNFKNFPIKVNLTKISTENGKLHVFLKSKGI